jgi:hypothetical protein
MDKRRLGIQTLVTQNVVQNEEIDLTTEISFNGTATTFDVVGKTENVDYTLINGKLKFLNTGSYTVEMTNNSLSQATDDYATITKAIATYNVILPTNIDNYKKKVGSILVSPNPAKDVLLVQSEDKINSLTVYDLSGRIVLPKLYANNKLNIGGLTNGNYLLKVASNNREMVLHFIKQ